MAILGRALWQPQLQQSKQGVVAEDLIERGITIQLWMNNR